MPKLRFRKSAGNELLRNVRRRPATPLSGVRVHEPAQFSLLWSMRHTPPGNVHPLREKKRNSERLSGCSNQILRCGCAARAPLSPRADRQSDLRTLRNTRCQRG